MTHRGIRQALAHWLFGLSLCLGSLQASAQPSQAPAPKSQESAAYRKAIREGVEEFDRGNYPEARAAFTRAHELMPNARTYRALGLVAFELRNYGEAVELLEAALSSREKPLDSALRKSTEELLERTRKLIARVHLDVSPPTPSKVLVDGVPVELSDGQTLVLHVGDHVIEVVASGYLPERRAVRVSGGEELKLTVQMRAPESSGVHSSASVNREQPPSPSEPKRDEPRRLRRNPWLWTAVGLVAVGAGVGIAYALRPEPKTRSAEPTGTDHTPPGGVLRPLRSW